MQNAFSSPYDKPELTDKQMEFIQKLIDFNMI